MKKNVASQHISCQMVSATDGSDFTDSVTVYVTGDNETQNIGSVGSGVCTHEGNGLHSYEPAQTETNYDYITFTFKGTGAITTTVHVYTSFPQTVDNATNITAIKTKTDYLPSATAGTASGVSIVGSKMDLKDAPNTTAISAFVTAILAGVIDGSVNLQTALKRLTAVIVNNTTCTDADPNVLAFKDNAGTSTVVTHSIPAAGTSRTKS